MDRVGHREWDQASRINMLAHDKGRLPLSKWFLPRDNRHSPRLTVSGQQNPSRIFAIPLAFLAKLLTTYGSDATAVAWTSIGVDSVARAFSQWTGRKNPVV